MSRKRKPTLLMVNRCDIDSLRIPICDGDIVKAEFIMGPNPLVIDYDGKYLLVGEMNNGFARRMRRLRSRR